MTGHQKTSSTVEQNHYVGEGGWVHEPPKAIVGLMASTAEFAAPSLFTQRGTPTLHRTDMFKKGCVCKGLQKYVWPDRFAKRTCSPQTRPPKEGIGSKQNRHVPIRGWPQGPSHNLFGPTRSGAELRAPKPGHQKGASALNRTNMVKTRSGCKGLRKACVALSLRQWHSQPPGLITNRGHRF